MNASTNSGIFIMLIVFVIIRYIYAVPHRYTVPVILVLSPIGAYLTSFLYSHTVYNHSVYLFICCSIGGSAGALSAIIMNPFLTKFKNDYISASRSGGSIFTLLSALLAILQSPGSEKPRFSVQYYLLIMAVILSLPVCAYFYIINKNIGLRENLEDINEFNSNDNNKNLNPLLLNSEYKILSNGMNNENLNENENNFNIDIVPNLDIDVIHENNLNNNNVDDDDKNVTVNSKNYEKYFFSKKNFQKYNLEKFINILPICLAVGYVNFNTWGMVSALAPFAFKNVTKNQESASVYLSLAYQLSSLLLVFGDLSTTLYYIPVNITLFFFTIFTGTIYLVALNISFFHTPFMAPILVIFFSFGRFFEANLLTTMYRKVATDYGPLER